MPRRTRSTITRGLISGRPRPGIRHDAAGSDHPDALKHEDAAGFITFEDGYLILLEA